MDLYTPINFKRWIDEHRHLLKPPVGNQVVWKDRDFIIMVVGGPNARTDYHLNAGEEFFYQLEGDITLRIQKDNKAHDIKLSEGDILLLPPNTPHSPRRPANTVGLVVERVRRPDELDGFIWHCENCNHKLYEEKFQLLDIVTQFPAIFDRFFGNPSLTKCKNCGTVMEKPNVPNK
jgi:3-hydroxyanthranilate 3,4-dioxygenase